MRKAINTQIEGEMMQGIKKGIPESEKRDTYDQEGSRKDSSNQSQSHLIRVDYTFIGIKWE